MDTYNVIPAGLREFKQDWNWSSVKQLEEDCVGTRFGDAVSLEDTNKLQKEQTSANTYTMCQ